MSVERTRALSAERIAGPHTFMPCNTAKGGQPRLRVEATCAAAVRFFYPATELRIRDVGLRRRQRAYPGLVEFRSLVVPGQRLLLPPRGYLSRLAYAVVAGTHQQDCQAALDRITEDLVVDGDPLLQASG